MKTINDAMLTEWVDLDLDGALGCSEKALLDEHLGSRPELRAERRVLAALSEMLAADRIQVRDGFKKRLMASLPVAAWEPQASRGALSWALPVAVMLLLGVAAVAIFSSAGGVVGESHVAATAATVFDFLQATTLAGAGLLFATLRGAGFGLEELTADSGFNLLAAAAFVLLLDLLFLSLLRRRPAPVERRSE